MGVRLVTTSRRVFAVAGLLLLIACQGGSPQADSPAPDSIEVTFPAADGVRLSGRLFGQEAAPVGVVLAHMLPADQSSWFDFAERLAGSGYRVLTFNFRGYCPGADAGCSEGEKEVSAIWQDVLGAIAFLKERGAAREFALMGASMGGTASLVAASRSQDPVVAVIALSAPSSIEGLTAGAEVLQAPGPARLFVAGEFDTSAAESARQMADASPQPKRLEIFPTPDHGTDLLEGSQGPNVSSLIGSYLAQFAPASGSAGS